MITDLCSKILPIKDKFEWIIGIERGGVHISTWLAYVLGKKHTSVKISFRGDNIEPQTDVQYQNPNTFLFDRPYLLVDDIIDSGKTINFFRKVVSPSRSIYWIATLHWCPENSPDCEPDFYVATKRACDWVVYHWEMDVSSTAQEEFEVDACYL